MVSIINETIYKHKSTSPTNSDHSSDRDGLLFDGPKCILETTGNPLSKVLQMAVLDIVIYSMSYIYHENEGNKIYYASTKTIITYICNARLKETYPIGVQTKYFATHMYILQEAIRGYIDMNWLCSFYQAYGFLLGSNNTSFKFKKSSYLQCH